MDDGYIPSIELESKLPPTSSGFLVDIGAVTVAGSASRRPLTRDSVLQQKYSVGVHRMFVGKSNKRKELAELDAEFTVPLFAPIDSYYERKDLEQLFESTLEELGSSQEIHEYLMATILLPEVRRNFTRFSHSSAPFSVRPI